MKKTIILNGCGRSIIDIKDFYYNSTDDFLFKGGFKIKSDTEREQILISILSLQKHTGKLTSITIPYLHIRFALCTLNKESETSGLVEYSFESYHKHILR